MRREPDESGDGISVPNRYGGSRAGKYATHDGRTEARSSFVDCARRHFKLETGTDDDAWTDGTQSVDGPGAERCAITATLFRWQRTTIMIDKKGRTDGVRKREEAEAEV